MKRGIVFSISVTLCIAAMRFLFADDPFDGLNALLESRGNQADVNIEIEDAEFGNEFVSSGKKIARDTEIARPATVIASGGTFWLDVSKNAAAEQELIEHSVLTHGDARQQLVRIKGKLQFRTIGKGQHAKVRPVILVESLKVRLGFPGDQHNPLSIKPVKRLK